MLSSDIIPSVIILSDTRLSNVALNVIMMSIIILSVVTLVVILICVIMLSLCHNADCHNVILSAAMLISILPNDSMLTAVTGNTIMLQTTYFHRFQGPGFPGIQVRKSRGSRC